MQLRSARCHLRSPLRGSRDPDVGLKRRASPSMKKRLHRFSNAASTIRDRIFDLGEIAHMWTEVAPILFAF
jgi:hypothetical protein